MIVMSFATIDSAIPSERRRAEPPDARERKHHDDPERDEHRDQEGHVTQRPAGGAPAERKHDIHLDLDRERPENADDVRGGDRQILHEQDVGHDRACRECRAEMEAHDEQDADNGERIDPAGAAGIEAPDPPSCLPAALERCHEHERGMDEEEQHTEAAQYPPVVARGKSGRSHRVVERDEQDGDCPHQVEIAFRKPRHAHPDDVEYQRRLVDGETG